jgi:hypothetical protein
MLRNGRGVHAPGRYERDRIPPVAREPGCRATPRRPARSSGPAAKENGRVHQREGPFRRARS